MKLSEFELEVMQLLWKLKESTAPEIHKAVLEVKKVTYSTVKTIIDRLEEKKAVIRVKNYGRTIVYAPAVSQDQLHKPLLKDFVSRVFAGNSRPLLNHLLEDDLLSQEDIDYLQAIVAKKNKSKS